MYRVVLAFAVATVLAVGEGAERPSLVTGTKNVRLDVRVYDLANVRATTLRRAFEECSQILATAGVDVRWEMGMADSLEARTLDMTVGRPQSSGSAPIQNSIAVRLERGLPSTAWRGSLGFSLPKAQYGVHVTVFADRVESLVGWGPPETSKILGHALAHEMVHVILDSSAHSERGLMKAVWTRADYTRMAAGWLALNEVEKSALPIQCAKRFPARQSQSGPKASESYLATDAAAVR